MHKDIFFIRQVNYHKIAIRGGKNTGRRLADITGWFINNINLRLDKPYILHRPESLNDVNATIVIFTRLIQSSVCMSVSASVCMSVTDWLSSKPPNKRRTVD